MYLSLSSYDFRYQTQASLEKCALAWGKFKLELAYDHRGFYNKTFPIRVMGIRTWQTCNHQSIAFHTSTVQSCHLFALQLQPDYSRPPVPSRLEDGWHRFDSSELGSSFVATGRLGLSGAAEPDFADWATALKANPLPLTEQSPRRSKKRLAVSFVIAVEAIDMMVQPLVAVLFGGSFSSLTKCSTYSLQW